MAFLNEDFFMKYFSDGKILGTLPMQNFQMFKSIACFMGYEHRKEVYQKSGQK